jgi:hypothetical protein
VDVAARRLGGWPSRRVRARQQIGVALGLVVLAGVAATVTAQDEDAAEATTALVAGYSSALTVAAALLLAAAALAFATLSSQPTGSSQGAATATDEA